MSLPQELQAAIHAYGKAVSGGDIVEGVARLEDLQAAIARFFYRPLPSGKLMCDLCAEIAAECEAKEAARIAESIRQAPQPLEPVSDADKLAAAVQPWRELVERAVKVLDEEFSGCQPDSGIDGATLLRDIRSLLEMTP